jgi:hypothetical protein
MNLFKNEWFVAIAGSLATMLVVKHVSFLQNIFG